VTMDPGIYHDLSFDEYAALPFLNQSVLKLIDPFNGGSPKHAKAAFDGLLRFDSQVMRLGRAEHCVITEGDEAFHQRFKVADSCCALLKSGDRKGERCGKSASNLVDGGWLCGMHSPKDWTPERDFVSADDYDRIQAMAASVKAHPIIKHLRRPGWSECTIVYDVPVKGATLDKSGPEPRTIHIDTTLRHKCRLDRLAQPTGKRPHLIIDLKRMPVGEGSAVSRSRAIERYGWDVQAAMYCEAVRCACGVKACEWIWIFVEEGYPHDVQVIPADDDTLAIGLDKLTRYRSLWAECEAKQDWPGQCAAEPAYGGLSEWSVREYRKKFGVDGKLMVEA
jgi:hypothetical protein